MVQNRVVLVLYRIVLLILFVRFIKDRLISSFYKKDRPLSYSVSAD